MEIGERAATKNSTSGPPSPSSPTSSRKPRLPRTDASPGGLRLIDPPEAPDPRWPPPGGHRRAEADTVGAAGDGSLAGFGAELEARATPEALAGITELDELSTTSKEQEAAAALEYFRLEWPGYFAVPADAPPVPDTVRVGPEGVEQTSASVAEAVERGDLPGLLSGFTGPVEVVSGECSPLPRQAAESTAAVFPDARLTIVPGAGHQVWYEAPGCLAAALSRVAARLA